MDDTAYPSGLHPFCACVQVTAARLACEPEDAEDIRQEMWLKILTVREDRPEASIAYVKKAAQNRALEFYFRKLSDGPLDRKTFRLDLSRMCLFDESEVAHHPRTVDAGGKTKAPHTARRRRSGKWS